MPNEPNVDQNLRQLPVVIQATHHSLVYEGKALAALSGATTIFDYIVTRLRKHWKGQIVLATSDQTEDDALSRKAQQLGLRCIRGSHGDLVRRLAAAADLFEDDHFVRAFGNYPLVDIEAMAALTRSHLSVDADYSYNDGRDGVPWGMGCEVIAKRTLKKLLALNLNREQREIGMLYIRQNPDAFSICRWESRYSNPHLKLAFETEQDLRLLRDIVTHIAEPNARTVGEYLSAHPVLAESNRESPSREVGLEKLFLHPAKTRRLQEQINGDVDFSYPVSVELSLTNRCNIDCAFCSDLDLRERQGMGEDLDTTALYRLFEDLKEGGTQGIVLEGGGEPSIHRDFERIVAKLSELGLAVGLITNGTIRIAPDVLSAFEWIRISLDASTAGEWKALKGKDMFGRVMANVHEYAKHCRTVGIGYVVTRNNMSDIETLVLRIRQHGVAYIQFRPVVDTPDLSPTEADIRYLHRYETTTFSVLTDGMTENLPTGNAGLGCRAHSLTTVVSANGGVYLCGRLNIHPWIEPIGNIRDEPFQDIWHGEERIRQSRQVADDAFCRAHCPQCRLTKVNRLLNRLQRTRTPHFV